jgi:hypothetical protein
MLSTIGPIESLGAERNAVPLMQSAISVFCTLITMEGKKSLVYVASTFRPTVDVTFESRLNPKEQLVWLCYSKFMGGSVPNRASHAGVSWLVVGSLDGCIDWLVVKLELIFRGLSCLVWRLRLINLRGVIGIRLLGFPSDAHVGSAKSRD